MLPQQPIRQWVLSFPYPLRFLFAARPAVLSEVLGIVYRAISTFLVRRAGLRVHAGACTGAVTLIQRFGSALNLNPHLHMLFLDGAYTFDDEAPRFHRVGAPTQAELQRLLHAIATRTALLARRHHPCRARPRRIHAAHPCAAPLRGSLRLCKSAILPIWHRPSRRP